MIGEKSYYFNINDVIKFKIVDNDNLFKKIIVPNIYEEYLNYLTLNIDEEELDFIINITKKISPSMGSYILDDKVYVKDKYIFARDRYKLAKWSIEIKEEKGKYIVNISPNLFTRLFISGFFGDFMVQLIATKKNIAIIHSSGVSYNGRACLFSGRGGSGKTTLAIRLIQEGFSFLGDDFIFLNRGDAIPYITPLNLFTYNLSEFLKTKLTLNKRVSLFYKNILYKLSGGYAKFFVKLNPKIVFPEKVSEKSKVQKIFLLFATTSANGSITKINKKVAIEHILYNQMLDSKYFPKYLVEYGFLNSFDFLGQYWEYYKRALVNNIPESVDFYKVLLPIDRIGKEKIIKELYEVVEV